MIAPLTGLQIELAEPISSKTARNGDTFRIVLAADLVIDGKTVLPAGVPGVGEVISASHPKFWSATSGELVLAARYLDLGTMRLPLRSFHMTAVGATHYMFTMYGMVDYGTNVGLPAGTSASAKVAGPCITAPAASDMATALAPVK